MIESNHRDVCSWSDIKGRLDPDWSYAVIETEAVSPRDAIFSAVTVRLAQHAAGIEAQEICRETSSGKLLMVVQIAPEQTDAVKQTLLDPRMPSSLTIIFYDYPPKGHTAKGDLPAPGDGQENA